MPNTVPNTAPPVRASADAGRAVDPDRLILRAGDARWAVAAADVLCIAEPPADLAPIPHAPAAVPGLAGIEGRPFAVLDLRESAGADGVLVVVASGTGGLALRADAVHRGDATARPLSDLLAGRAPWAPPPAAGRAPVLRPAAPAAPARRVPLLLVSCGTATAALPVGRVGRVGMVTAHQPLRGGSDGGGAALVRVDGALLPARRLADALPTLVTEGSDPRWAVVLREDGQDTALLVDRVLGLEPCDARSIATVTLPGGRPQRWLNRPDADPVPVMDGAAPPAEPAAEAANLAGARADAVLSVQAGDLRLALPLALVDRVTEPGMPLSARPAPGLVPAFDLAAALGRRARPRAGVLVRVITAGGEAVLLSVDRVLALSAPPSPWQPLEPLPPVAAFAFDAASRDGDGWLLRLRRDLPASLAALPRPVRRALAAARLGWAALDTPA